MIQITLIGRLITPLIASKPFYKKRGCWIKVTGDLEKEKKARLSIIGKLVKGERKAPVLLRGYRGFVKISAVGNSEERTEKKVKAFLASDFLGCKTNSGYGQVKWLKIIKENHHPPKPPQYKKLYFRKGLGSNYPEKLYVLIRTLLLHDFVHTEKHQSKIYKQVEIEDKTICEACLHHHDDLSNNVLLPLVKYYDHLASYISRKKAFGINTRYDFQNGKIDFNELKRKIEERQQSAFKLYQFVHESKELKRIVESMYFGKNSLRNHLLIMVNLAINDWLEKKLRISNGKYKIISPSATTNEEKAKHSSAKDAEMHSFHDHEQR